MTSLCRHFSVVSTGNCKLGHDCRRVCSHRRRDKTVSSRRRRRCVLGINLLDHISSYKPVQCTYIQIWLIDHGYTSLYFLAYFYTVIYKL